VPQTSQPPPPSSGGNLKYVLIGLLFLGAGGVISWIAAGKQDPPEPAAAPPAPEPARANPMAEQNLVLEEQPPVQEPVPEPEATPAPKNNRPKGGGDWDCQGEVATAAAMKVINENRAQIRSCYERRLKVNNILQGDLRLRLKVGSGGKVTATSLSGSLKDSDVFACVRNIAQAWTFAAPTGGNCAVVAVPFTFSPKQ
jgi:outer membrane biosynthesis protein TonB